MSRMSKPAAIGPDAAPRLAMPWRVGLVFALGVAAFWATVRGSEAVFGAPDGSYDRTAHAIGSVATAIVVVALVWAAARALDRRTLAAIGLGWPRQSWRFFLVGAMAWLVPATIAIAICALSGLITVDLMVSPGRLVTIIAAQVMLVFLMEALPEELLFRGYVFVSLAERLTGWILIGAQAGLFTIFAVLLRGWHGPDGLAFFFGMGIGIGYLRAITGSVWTSIGFHTAFQTVAQLMLPGQLNPIAAEPVALLQVVCFGVAPFAVGAMAVESIVRSRPHWLAGHTSLATAAR